MKATLSKHLKRTGVSALLCILLLPACAQDIGGLSQAERFQLYSLGATLAGQPAAGTALGVLARSMDKTPQRVTP